MESRNRWCPAIFAAVSMQVMFQLNKADHMVRTQAPCTSSGTARTKTSVHADTHQQVLCRQSLRGLEWGCSG